MAFVLSCLVLLTVTLWSLRVVAADQVALITPERPSALVSEATIRVAAELRAAGFVVVEHDPESWQDQDQSLFVGRIELQETTGSIEIVTSSGRSGITLRQSAHPSDGVTTAEVIAVRAVESLRATLLQAVRNQELADEDMTSAVQTFTGQEDSLDREEKPARTSPATPEPPPEVSPDSRKSPQRNASRPPRALRSVFALSPSLVSLGDEDAFSGALEARALLHFEGPSIGIVAEGSLLPHRRTTNEGETAVRHLLIMARPGWVFSSTRSLEFHLGVSAGLAYVYLNTTPSQMTRSRNVVHRSAVVQGDLAIARFWESGLGAQIFGRFGSLLDAPSIEDDANSQVFGPYGRPLISAGIGIAYRIPKGATAR